MVNGSGAADTGAAVPPTAAPLRASGHPVAVSETACDDDAASACRDCRRLPNRWVGLRQPSIWGCGSCSTSCSTTYLRAGEPLRAALRACPVLRARAAAAAGDETRRSSRSGAPDLSGLSMRWWRCVRVAYAALAPEEWPSWLGGGSGATGRGGRGYVGRSSGRMKCGGGSGRPGRDAKCKAAATAPHADAVGGGAPVRSASGWQGLSRSSRSGW